MDEIPIISNIETEPVPEQVTFWDICKKVINAIRFLSKAKSKYPEVKTLQDEIDGRL